MRLRLRHRAEPPVLTLLDAMADPQLFGPWFRDPSTWAAWRAFLKALFGLPMTLPERVIFKRHTGRTRAPTHQVREGWIICGRRAGKSFIAALVSVFLCCFRDYRAYLSPGEVATVMVIAADRKQARTIMRYARALVENIPMLSRMIEHIGLESITLSNSTVLEIHTASYRSTRGYTCAACICDELAFWRSEDSANPDVEILDAIRPAMATIPHSLLLCLSSPYSRRGALWDAFNEHYGHDDDDGLVWRADTRSMNRTVPQSIIDKAMEADPAAAQAEYMAEFRSDVAGFLQEEWIDAGVREGLYEIPPQAGASYVAWTDPSGGRHDSFTLSIAHSEGKRLILDVCRARRPPFNPQSVVAEFAGVLKSYALSRVTGDRYAAEFVVSAFQSNGISYVTSERSTSDCYLEILPHFAQGAVQLLDNRTLLNELRQLERRAGQVKDTVTHPPRSHDDCAASACGALLLSVRSVPLNLGAEAYYAPDAADRRAALHDLDEHLAADLGYGGIGADSDSPLNWKDDLP